MLFKFDSRINKKLHSSHYNGLLFKYIEEKYIHNLYYRYK
jgi:hypothetical protein